MKSQLLGLSTIFSETLMKSYRMPQYKLQISINMSSDFFNIIFISKFNIIFIHANIVAGKRAFNGLFFTFDLSDRQFMK